MKIGGKKITLRMMWGLFKIVTKGLISAYATESQEEEVPGTVTWVELTYIMIEASIYLGLPVDTKGLKLPEYLFKKLQSYQYSFLV